MLTNDQKALLKKAQREAGIEDAEYRDVLELIAGVRSSTDPAVGDRHLDKLMAFFEAIAWRRRDSGEIPPPKPNSAFRERGYWARKNTATSTSRDRYHAGQVNQEIADLEARLIQMGYGQAYCAAIERRTKTPMQYLAALRRTLAAWERTAANCPF